MSRAMEYTPKVAARVERQRQEAQEANRERDARIMTAALAEALSVGWLWITRKGVAERAGVAVGTVNSAYKTMVDLKREVMRQAVAREILPLIAQGLAEQSAIAQAAPPDLQQRALASLAAPT